MNNSEGQKDKKLWEFYQNDMRDKFVQAQPRFEYLIKLIKQNKKKGKHLDIGLGDGYLLEHLSKEGYECYGMDLAEESIAANRKRFEDNGLEIALYSGNINNMPFNDGNFDIVTASEVLEHLNDEDLSIGIREVYRCLMPGGIFLGTVPADENLRDSVCYCPNCNEVFHRWGHKQSFSKRGLEQIFSNVLFSDIKIFKIPSIPHKPDFIEWLKFKIKWCLSFIMTTNPYIGNYIIIAKK